MLALLALFKPWIHPWKKRFPATTSQAMPCELQDWWPDKRFLREEKEYGSQIQLLNENAQNKWFRTKQATLQCAYSHIREHQLLIIISNQHPFPHVVLLQMCSPHGTPNLLTSAADKTWKTVRRAVAISFSSANIKRKFPVVFSRTNQLIEWIRTQGPATAIDVDQAALRITLDVIGLLGFGHDFGSVKLQAVPRDHLLRVMPRCFTEVCRMVSE